MDGRDLKTSFHDVISDHSSLSYSGLWDAYYITDVDEEGYIVDVYSDFRYVPGADQNSGSASREGDNYNREHVIPQSIFNENLPMRTDLFHVLPTDSMVNNWRSNYPHAEVRSANRTSSNGTKVGTSATSGVSGSVCEPADEWKGDFARIYFYFATCYQDRLSGFKNYAPPAKNSFPSLSTWAIDLYCRWAQEDPVSDWEIQRNNAVYSIQGNRNPFIDFPELETVIW